jgi:predicted MFS family arabinose efflux permease
MAGLVVLAIAPGEKIGFIGALMVAGVAWTVLRTVDVVWVNQRSTSDVRATVQSFLGQCESFGEVVGGVALGIVAERAGIPPALLCSTGLIGLALVLVLRSRAARSEPATVAA